MPALVRILSAVWGLALLGPSVNAQVADFCVPTLPTGCLNISSLTPQKLSPEGKDYVGRADGIQLDVTVVPAASPADLDAAIKRHEEMLTRAYVARWTYETLATKKNVYTTALGPTTFVIVDLRINGFPRQIAFAGAEVKHPDGRIIRAIIGAWQTNVNYPGQAESNLRKFLPPS